MCQCAQQDAEAIENALIALDGAISALVMARIILEQRQKGEDAVLPVPVTADPPPEEEEGCAHGNVTDIRTMAGGARLCNDCGEEVPL